MVFACVCACAQAFELISRNNGDVGIANATRILDHYQFDFELAFNFVQRCSEAENQKLWDDEVLIDEPDPEDCEAASGPIECPICWSDVPAEQVASGTR